MSLDTTQTADPERRRRRLWNDAPRQRGLLWTEVAEELTPFIGLESVSTMSLPGEAMTWRVTVSSQMEDPSSIDPAWPGIPVTYQLPAAIWRKQPFEPITRGFVVNVASTGRFQWDLDQNAYVVLDEAMSEATIRLRDLLFAGEVEVAETGYADEFGARLEVLIRDLGTPALDALSRSLEGLGASDSVAFEALKRLGAIDHPPSYRRRFALLADALNSRSSVVRDGAGLGLAFLDDPNAIGSLRDAISREQVEDLREDLRKVLDQLQETSRSAETA